MTNWLSFLQGNQSVPDPTNPQYTYGDYLNQVNTSAAAQGQSPALLAQVLGDESSFQANPPAQPVGNGSHASGIGQIQPGTAANNGYFPGSVDPSDPIASIDFTSQYLAARGGAGYSTYGAASSQSGSTQTGTLNVAGAAGMDFDSATQGNASPSIADIGSSGVLGATAVPSIVNNSAAAGTSGPLAAFTQAGPLSGLAGSWGAFFVRCVIVVLGIGLLFIAVLMFKDDNTVMSTSRSAPA